MKQTLLPNLVLPGLFNLLIYKSYTCSRIHVWVMLLLLLAGRVAFAQAPAWELAVTPTQPSGYRSEMQATAADANGNVYVVGAFTGPINFGSISILSTSGTQAFIAKWSSATNSFVWVQRLSNLNSVVPTAVAVSGTSVYVAGNFTGLTLRTGNTVLVNPDAANAANTECGFVTKLTDAGTTSSFVWGMQVSGATGHINALAANGASIYLAGWFLAPALNFGSVVLPNAQAGSYNAFVTKLTDNGSSGSFLWAQATNGGGFETANGLAVNGNSVYVIGDLIGSNYLAMSYPNYNTMFIAKFADAGSTSSFVWGTTATGTQKAAAIAVQGQNVYATGAFYGPTAAFGSVSLASNDVTPGAVTYRTDIFVVKLADVGPTGSFVWGQRAGGPGNDQGTAVAAYGSNVYVAGEFKADAAAFGSTTLTNVNSSSNNAADVFVSKLTDAGMTGSFGWALAAGSTLQDNLRGIALTGTSLYTAGVFYRSAGFGSNVVTSMPTYNSGFLASISDASIALLPTLTTSAATGLVGSTISLTGNNLSTTTALTLNGQAITGYVVNASGTSISVVLPVGATSGTFTVTTANGTATSGLFCVQYQPTATAASRCGPGTLVLAAAGAPAAPGVNYVWYTQANGGTAIAGATSSSYTTPVLYPSRSGLRLEEVEIEGE